ncbi:dephospho-CoA kinase isoform X1 [Ziziphus jujuba]|uniref:Dephospho-CoA kinase isoform X1 n=1 Tax=Ziziphus jujuba TaxID=326968 RepID=A0ABM3IWH1_ZIZJJ|nr:dephospho-CoA kinase isoform X1 [Ziziphus jujuba]
MMFNRHFCRRMYLGVAGILDKTVWGFVNFNRGVNGIQSRVRDTRMRLVGLTGGISSGKSTVSNLFKSHGIPVVDADLVARNVVKKGTGGWKKVVATFGDEILQSDGEVDRARLGQIVFSDPGKRQVLNKLLAPYISSGIFWEIFKLWIKGFKVIVLDIPLLFEAKMDRWTKPIIVVWVDPVTQLQRLMARDGTSEEDAHDRINAQMSLDLKRSRADIVIDNTGSLDDLKEHFREVLFEVTRPLTWTEFGLSRQGALFILGSVIVGVIVCKKQQLRTDG